MLSRVDGLVVRFHHDAASFLENAEPLLLGAAASTSTMLYAAARRREAEARGEPVAPGRLATVAASPEGPAIAAALQQGEGKLLLTALSPEVAVALSERLWEAGWRPSSVGGPARGACSFAEAWAQRLGTSAIPGMLMAVYRLVQVRAVPEVAGRLRSATSDDVPLLSRWYAAFVRETGIEARLAPDAMTRLVGAGRMFVWDDGEPVSMAGWARPTANAVSISFVYTPPGQRGSGRATACVAGLSQHLLARGHRMCCLYADLANPTSNELYRRVGYEQVDEWSEHRFE